MNRQLPVCVLVLTTTIAIGIGILGCKQQTTAAPPLTNQPAIASPATTNDKSAIIAAFNQCAGKPPAQPSSCSSQNLRERNRIMHQVAEFCRQGDRDLLPRFLEGALNSDGAFAEAYAAELAEFIDQQPNVFFPAVMAQPPEAQTKLLQLADYGLSFDQRQSVPKKLKTIAKQPKHPSASIAQAMLQIMTRSATQR